VISDIFAVETVDVDAIGMKRMGLWKSKSVQAEEEGKNQRIEQIERV